MARTKQTSRSVPGDEDEKSSSEWDFDVTEEYNEFCQTVATWGPIGFWMSKNVLMHLSVNAPVLMSFCLTCTLLYVCFPGNQNVQRMLGVHDTWSTFRVPLQYTSLFTHIFAHSDFNHLRGNMQHLLLVGPSVEHTFGSKNIVIIILVVALSSAAAHILVGSSYTHQLGASGVVFAFILLSSLVSANNGKIPVSFLIIFVLYMGDEFYDFFFSKDATSHHAHLTGGAVGAAAGFYIMSQKRMEKARNYVNAWKSKGK